MITRPYEPSNRMLRQACSDHSCSRLAEDQAFASPTEPIGPILHGPASRRTGAERGWVVADDAGGGFAEWSPRRARLPSVEVAAIKSLLSIGTHSRSPVVVAASRSVLARANGAASTPSSTRITRAGPSRRLTRRQSALFVTAILSWR